MAEAEAPTMGDHTSPRANEPVPGELGELQDASAAPEEGVEEEVDLTPAEIMANKLKIEQESKTEAIAAEHTVIRAIESAIVARQAAEAHKDIVEKAKSEANVAALKASAAISAAETAKKAAQQKNTDMEKAEVGLKRAIDERKEAEDKAENAATGMATAAKSVAAAEAELKSAATTRNFADKEVRNATDKARAEVTEVKWAKKEADKTTLAAQDAVSAEGAALNAIADAEQTLISRQEVASSLAKVAYDLRDEQEEAEKAVERAARAVAEFDGEGGAWAIRTQEQLKDREKDLAKISAQSAKASKAETEADQAVDQGQKRLNACKEDYILKQDLTVKAEAAATEAARVLVDQTAASELAAEEQAVAEKAAAEADAAFQIVQKKLEHAQQAASTTYVEHAAHAAKEAKVVESQAVITEERCKVAAAEAKEAEAKAAAEKETAVAFADQKAAQAEKATDKEKDAVAKANHVDELVQELDSKVLALAVAKYAVRGAHMDVEDAKAMAVESRATRRAAAVKDLRVLTMAKEKAEEFTAPDKWYVFHQWVQETPHPDMGLWNMRRLFYSIDGKLRSNLEALLSDFVGSALDRRKGPAMAKYCKLAGSGLKEASLGQVTGARARRSFFLQS